MSKSDAVSAEETIQEGAPVMDEQASPQQAAEQAQKVELTVLEGGEPAAPSGETSVKSARFAPLGPATAGVGSGSMDLLFDVDLNLSVELGRATMPVREILQLGPGSIIELQKLAGEPVDIMVNGKLIARGEVVVVDENFGVRVTEIASPSERLGRLA